MIALTRLWDALRASGPAPRLAQPRSCPSGDSRLLDGALGSTCTTALRWICTSTPLAHLDVRKPSDRRVTFADDAASSRHFVTLGHGVDHGAVFFLALHLGRIMTKYSTTNMSTRAACRSGGHDVTAASGCGRCGLGESGRNKHGLDSTTDGQNSHNPPTPSAKAPKASRTGSH